jgi:hypothetical protein
MLACSHYFCLLALTRVSPARDAAEHEKNKMVILLSEAVRSSPLLSYHPLSCSVHSAFFSSHVFLASSSPCLSWYVFSVQQSKAELFDQQIREMTSRVATFGEKDHEYKAILEQRRADSEVHVCL